MNIIVIDDEKEMLDIYSSLLESRGHTVEAFSSSPEALSRIKKHSFNLIITDKKMPQLTGLDILNYIEEHSKQTPVFMITGDDHREIKFSNPESRVLKKPISFEELFDHIKTLS